MAPSQRGCAGLDRGARLAHERNRPSEAAFSFAQRRYVGPKRGANPDHTRSSHRRYAEWTPHLFRRWAGKIGPSPEGLISAVLASRPHPKRGFRALELGALACKSVASLRRQARQGGAERRQPNDALRPRQSARSRLPPSKETLARFMFIAIAAN